MAAQNMIQQILESNDIAELYLADGQTRLEMETWIACQKNPDNTKENEIPLVKIHQWLNYLKNHTDVQEVESVHAGFSPSRGTGKEMRVQLVLMLNGAIKQPKKSQAFDQVFLPIRDTLLKLLSQEFSFEAFETQHDEAKLPGSEEEQEGSTDPDDEDEFSLATQSN